MPAHGSWTHRAPGAASSTDRRPAGWYGPNHTTASADAGSTSSPPPSTTASAIQAGTPSGARATFVDTAAKVPATAGPSLLAVRTSSPASDEPALEVAEDAAIEGDVPYRPGTARAALASRDFRIVWTGALGSNIGTWMQNVV